MENRQSVLIRAAGVLAASGLAAGVAGGISGLIANRRQKPAVQIRPDAVSDSIRLDEIGERAQRILGESKRALSDSDLIRNKRWQMKRATSDDVSEIGSQVKQALMERTERFGTVAADALHDAADRLSHELEDSKEARERARAIAEKQRQAGAERAKRFSAQAGDQLSDIEKQVAETIEDRIKPSLDKAGRNASQNAGELRARLGAELAHLGEVADERRPQLARAADQVSARITHLLDNADETGEDWLHHAEHSLRDAEKVIQDNALAARQRAGEMTGSAKAGGKDFGSLLFWLVVAGGLIYAVLLDEDQKRKSRELAVSAYHEGKELYTDVRGRNAEFTE